MEDEVEAICSELAKSIQRESNLEIVVDRLQEQIVSLQVSSSRSSRCSSDSGYASERLSEYDHRRQEIERIQRECEVEMASIRLENCAKLRDERLRRKVLEQEVDQLTQEKDQRFAQSGDLEVKRIIDKLESTCVDLRRRLSEEKVSHRNFQCLFLAVQSELQQVCEERDNFKQALIPQLCTKSENLDTNPNISISKQTQQLQERDREALRNTVSRDQRHTSRSTFAGVCPSSNAWPAGFSAIDTYQYNKGETQPTREVLAELLRDVEAQRDALHIALKNLLDRQELQSREHQRKIENLESEHHRLVYGKPPSCASRLLNYNPVSRRLARGQQ
ncbi:hypothetical protein VCV18_012573 [Metarhizium anisopliae]|uniref:Uncharacterized protein n=1 Tax=Metarhizium rileyi (strain RCEF 4871) TaxID=1649241 RepID=A0A5C6G747_METRR|nr:hypothetical protein ED733_000653 [Metarhizium rileyi]